MQPGLLVKVLPRKARVVGEGSEIGRILVGQVGPERIAVLPLPHRIVVDIGDQPRRVQMIAMDVIHLRVSRADQQ